MHSEKIEVYRDRKWRRDENLRLKTAKDVEAMIDELGFCLTLTDSRTNCPSVYIGVCGRRDALTPKNVQKDEECSLAWVLKDEVMRRGNVYYSKLSKGRATFVSRKMIPYFHAIYGFPKSKEAKLLSPGARRILKVLRKEWEAATSDLREDAGFDDRKSLTKAIEELQRCMKVIAYEVVYQPRFSYLWTLADARFPEELARRVSREDALVEISRAYLNGYGMTLKAEFSRALGIDRKEAGMAFQSLVEEDIAIRVEDGVYMLSELA